jgi:hypothetical protein
LTGPHAIFYCPFIDSLQLGEAKWPGAEDCWF